ncbi:hypothetical protein CYY_009142 [Polysphondylium violaceum]|uniref:Uncharacterized protein n=1 Tax=Polysphondylium violaceum TaxID=133409 RepID=A0A8J4PM16_9MYCE|nr:hypothetical protein CYY_009142 [Polysphondylium violaceum]
MRPQQSIDNQESKNFYAGDFVFWANNPNVCYEKLFKITLPTIENKSKTDSYFWYTFRNVFIRNHIWSFIHKPLVPYKRYRHIYSIKWIFKNAHSIQLLIDKVKRNEYLCDILYISNVLDQFKSINDIEFYTIFNQRYARYLCDPVMAKVKRFLDATLNNRQEQEEKEPIILFQFLSGMDKENDPSYINHMNLKQLMEEYRGTKNIHFNNFKRAFESKHLELAKFVFRNWLEDNDEGLNPRNDYGFIHMGDTEIIKYFCQVNHNNRFNLKVGLGNIYLRDDFEEIMKLLEDSGVIDKQHEEHMDGIRCKRNLEYFIKNGYAFSESLPRTVGCGDKLQFDCLPLLMNHIDFDPINLIFLFYYKSMLPRELVVYNQFFKRYTMVELKEKHPYVSERFTRYQEMYQCLYQPDYQNVNTLKDLPVKIRRIGEIGDSSAILTLIKSHFSEFFFDYSQYLDPYSPESRDPDYADDDDYVVTNHLTIELLLFALVEESNVPLLKMIFQEFPQLLDTVYKDQERVDRLVLKAFIPTSLELLDYIIDTLKLPPPSPSILISKNKKNPLILSYLLNKISPTTQSTLISNQDIIEYEKKYFCKLVSYNMNL